MSSSSPNPRSPGSHPIGTEHRRRPWWLLALLAIAVVVALLLLLAQCNGHDGPSSAASANNSAAATEVSSASGSSAPTAGLSDAASPGPEVTTPVSPTSTADAPASTPASSSAPTTGTGDNAGTDVTGTLTAGSTTLLPASDSTPTGDLTALAKQPVAARGVEVLSVPADEGFWVGSATSDRIWVQLSGTGESAYQVAAGDLIDFTGSMRTHGAGFAARVGVDEKEGAAQLTSEKAHIKADRATVQLSAR